MKIERFEDIKAWQEARELARLTYSLTKQPAFTKDFGLKDQIQRAAVSVMANIAEGFDRRTKKEFTNFLSIALSSATEVKSHLYVALDQGYITKADFDAAYERCTQASRLIFGFMKYLSDSR
jgi:four helix bundle protein